MTKQKKEASAVIHAHDGHTPEVGMALYEQLFEIKGADSVQRLIADRLRDPEPSRFILDMLADMLDGNSLFRLTLDQRRDGKSWTTRVNDAAIAKAIRNHPLTSKRGGSKIAVADVAEQFEVSEAKVRQVKRTLRSK